MKEKLVGLCDPKDYFLTGLVLKDDSSTFAVIFRNFMLNNKLTKLLVSAYVRKTIRKFNLHNHLSNEIPHYSECFTEMETNFMIETLIQKFGALDKIEKLSRKIVGTNPVKVALELALN
jgi:hypothetical protein